MTPTFITKRANELVPGDMFIQPGQDTNQHWLNIKYCCVIETRVTSKKKINILQELAFLSKIIIAQLNDFSPHTISSRISLEFDQKLICLVNLEELVALKKAEIKQEKEQETKEIREESGALTVGQLIDILNKRPKTDYVIFNDPNEGIWYINSEGLDFEAGQS